MGAAARCALVLLVAGCGRGSYAPSVEDWADAAATDPYRVWSRDLGRAVEYAPVPLDGDWLVALTDRRLARVDAATGETVFEARLESAPAGPPLVAGGFVVSYSDYPKPRLVGHDPDDGEARWERERSVQRAVAAGDTVFTVEDPGRLAAVTAADGVELWDRPCPGAGPGAPVVAGSLLLVPVRPDSVVAVSRADGATRWAVRVGFSPRLALDGDAVSAACADSQLVRLDAATGAERDRRTLPGKPAGPLAVAGEARFLATTDGRLFRLDGDGAMTWEARVPAPVVTPPVVGGAVIALAAPRGRIHLFDPATGEPREILRHPERILAAPGLAGGTLLVGGSGGTVTAYREDP